MKVITNEQLNLYKDYLISDEKSKSTINKYLHDLKAFMLWTEKHTLCKECVISYKTYLVENFAPTSINSILSSLNSFFNFMKWYDLKVKIIKIQKQIFSSTDKELTKSEYYQLLQTAKQKHNKRLYLIIQTICSTGIRVSELQYVTVKSVKCGIAKINCKGKQRQVFLPSHLCRALKEYIRNQNIETGSVFITKNGNPIDRSNIWSDMKKLCKDANVPSNKVFPHNLRHLFARTYYSLQKDIVRLADILGHSNVNTTRIYTAESGETHRKQIEKLELLRC